MVFDNIASMLVEKNTEQRIKLYYDLYVPDGARPKPMPLIIALHGYEGNKESMMALALKINSRDFIIASVQGPSGFLVRDEKAPAGGRVGFGWMMQYKAEDTIELHHKTLLCVIDDVSAEQRLDRRAIFLMAFSQTVSLNYRFAFTHPGLVRGIVSVCGGIPGDWNEDKYQPSETDVLIVAGETDDIYPLERTRTFKDAIARRARAVDYKAYPVGHVFPRESLPLINEWMLQRI